ncbi:fat-body protein 1 [Drosophila bipectinata]|uniref:fat-body protein 1 n=1 Tax=Drosophila bipectinata TaxID=42026 RepID=UPI001C8995D9|nr:fat-body protein 1 [Drosophila bipectinata]
MNRILLLVACAVGLVAAGRISVNPQRIQDRMSQEDLQRQKFILDIVRNIRQPLQQNELIQLDQGLIVDSQRYRGGIDEDMQEVIDLDRQRRLLDEHQVYSVAQPEDVQQLRGIYRLLVRAQDFDTLSRNVVYLRRNINPVLLVNALALAIRDREDTQNLIMPAVQELLPELYLNEQVIQGVRGQSQRPSLMDIVNVRQRAMNPIMSILMPWRDLHMQMALIKQQQALRNRQTNLGQKRVVVSAETAGQIEGTSLLTDDIALRNFVQNLIQELAMQEQTQDQREEQVQRLRDQDQWISRIGQQDRELVQNMDTSRLLRVNRRRLQEQQQQEQDETMMGNQRDRFERILRRDEDRDDDIRMGRVQLERDIGQGGIRMGGVRGLPTSSVNSGRLLHINRRRLQEQEQDQEQEQVQPRWRGLVRGDRLSEGRRVGQEQEDEEQMRQTRWQMRRQKQQGQRRQDEDEDEMMQRQWQGRSRQLGQQGQERLVDQLESVSRDDERLVHINRRRLNQDTEQQQQRIIPRRINSIGEGRRVLGGRLIQDEDILKLIRSDNRLALMSDDEILEMLKRNREQRQRNEDDDDNNNDDDEDVDDIRERRTGIRSRRSLQTSLRRRQDTRRNEILLHTLRQLVARLNQENIAQGQMQEQQSQWINNPRLSQSERYALRMNQISIDSVRGREMLERIGRIEQRLQMAIGQVLDQMNMNTLRGQVEEQRQVESLMADVLLGRLGQVGILDIVRQLVQDNNQQVDRSGLSVRLSDPLVQHVLRRIVRIVDRQREEILGAYRQEQLEMRGVTINDVRVDKLRTRIEEHDMDISNLVEGDQVIVGRQRRLNNQPFTIDMDISSERDQDAIIRVFLGPGQQQDSLEDRRRDFVLLDSQNVRLQMGRNRIQQRSMDILWTTRDVTPLAEIYRRVMLQLRGQQELGVQELVGENGRFPQHLLLPRGRPEGLPMQILVVVSPVIEMEERMIEPEISIGIGQASLQDIRPLGYPLDRRIVNEQALLQLPNIQLQDVVIVQEN